MPAVDAGRVRAIVEAAREAGALALARAGEEFRRWEKAPGHPVCEVDLQVDALLRGRLRDIEPEAGWLSEESADEPSRVSRRCVWVVDPIDGTRDYLRGRPGWCVSVALVQDGRPIVGVLEAPARGERWIAVAGGGACLNGAPLRASSRSILPGSRIPADTLPRPDAELFPVPRANSIALRIAMVAADTAELCASVRPGNEWDLPAAMLIVEEAGGIVTDRAGQPIRFNKPLPTVDGVIAAASGVHAAAVARVAERRWERSGRA